jgi:hypothetical protein
MLRGYQARAIRGAELGLLALMLILFTQSSRLHAEADVREQPADYVPAPSAFGAANEPPDGFTPGPADPANTEYLPNSVDYNDDKDNLIETHLHDPDTHRLVLVRHFNWYYAHGDPGSVTVYHIGSNGTITTTLTTYTPEGHHVKSEEHWTTKSNGIVSDSNSTMFPNGAENSDPTYYELHEHQIGTIYLPMHEGGGSYSSINPPAYEPGSFTNGWYSSVYGGANIYQNYGAQKLQTTVNGAQGIIPGNFLQYLGGSGGLQVGYNFNPLQVGPLTIQPAVAGDVSWLGTSFTQNTGNSQVLNTLNTIPVTVTGFARFPLPCHELTPYLGVGLGFDVFQMRSFEQGFGGASSYSLGNSTVIAPALSEVIGADYRLGTTHWSVFGEFKMNEAFGPRFSDANAGGKDFTYTDHDGVLTQGTINAGFSYHF